MYKIAHIVTESRKTIISYLCLEQFAGPFPDGRVLIVVPHLAVMNKWVVDIGEPMHQRFGRWIWGYAEASVNALKKTNAD